MTVNDQDPYSVNHTDEDPDETAEWQESLDALVASKGPARGRDVMLSLLKRSKDLHLGVPMVPTTDYINTIAPTSIEGSSVEPPCSAVPSRNRSSSGTYAIA